VTGPWVPPTPKMPKPPWHSRNMRDVEWMKDWVKERLEVRRAESFNRLYRELCEHGGVEIEANGPATVVYYKWQDLIDMAYEATEDDQAPIERLREAMLKRGGDYAKLAPLIRPNRGQGGRRHKRDFAMERAIEDVHFIRDELWPREHNGRWKRSRDNPPSAEEIVAEFHGVDYNTLVQRAGKNFARKSTI
jgi:hypothetical protein